MEELNNAVTKLPPDVSYQVVEAALLPILDAATQNDETKPVAVTPLMVACDMGQTETVRFLLDHQVGHVLEKEPGTGNTAVHHAAMSGKVEILDQLLLPQDDDDDDALASCRNAHGDTPIMMACVQDCLEFLQYWLVLVKESTLRLRNDSNDSAMSLACGRGRVEVVKLLLRTSASIAEQDDLLSAEASLLKMEDLLKRPLGPDVVQNILNERHKVQQCADLVREALQRRADSVAQQLLMEREAAPPPLKPARKTRPRKSKPKRPTRDVRLEDCRSKEKKSNCDTPEKVALKHLEDGTRAVVVQGTPLYEGKVTTPTAPTRAQRSVDELFRERFGYCEIEGIMDSLCLDVSQLLLTPHGMALGLSASQLDAVDQILERQRAAVQQAREIQARLHETAKEPLYGVIGSNANNDTANMSSGV